MFVMLILSVNFSCNKKHTKKPDDIIDKQNMIAIMVDMNVFEAAMRVNHPQTTQDSLNVKQYYNEIFRKFKITKPQFEKSLEYYSKQPDKFGEIYDEVITRLSRMQSEESVRK